MMQQCDLQLDRRRASWRYRVVMLFVTLAVCATCPGVLPAQEQAWEYAPYQVRIWLATETAAELSPGVQQLLSDALAQRIEAFIGAPWNAEISEPPADLRSSMLIDPALVTPEVLAEVAPESLDGDKIILLTVQVSDREFVVEAREIDCRTRLVGAPVRRIVRQPELLDIACFEAIADSFRAITRLEEGASQSAIVRIRAGGLVLSQSSPCYVGADDILLPIQRNNDRSGQPSRIVPIEWTFLQVQTPDEVNPYLMTCRVWSGKPNPVTGRLTSRKERYGLKVKPTAETTMLQVSSRVVRRDEEPYPMPGLEVYAKAPEPDPPAQPESAAPKVQGDPAELLGRTDWNGTLEIGQGETPLRILYLKNGAQLLARLPMVPGLDPVLVASVPDDALRLQAEGFVKGIQGKLMDLEAQREILKARFMLRIEEGKVDEAQALLEEIKQLPTRDDLVRLLNIQQNQQVESPVKAVQSRIDQLYARLREALGKYLSPNLTNELTRVLNDARRQQPEAVTAVGP